MKKFIYLLILVIVIVLGLVIFRSTKNKKGGSLYKNTGGVVAIPEVKLVLPEINIGTSGFEPAVLKVRLGTKVSWKNMSGKPVEINSAKHPTHEEFPPLNLNLVPDAESVSLIFNEPGTYKYHNHLIPSQTGQIVVE